MAESSAKIVSNNVNLQHENKLVDCSDSVEDRKAETAMEPMLLEEYKESNLPLSLRNLLNHFKQKGNTLDKNDIAVIIIYILMLETGFVTTDLASIEAELNSNFHYKRLLSQTNSMPRNWKRSNGTYVLSFILASCPTDVCTVTCIPVSDDLVVNCSMRLTGRSVSMLMDPSMYIVNNVLYQNLRNLSIKFKTDISNPCKMAILEVNAMRPVCLNYLPPEVFGYIRKYCDKETLANLDRI